MSGRRRAVDERLNSQPLRAVAPLFLTFLTSFIPSKSFHKINLKSNRDLTFQFIYGDGEATSDLEFPEQVGRCMNVKSSEFCFLGLSEREALLNAGTWNVTNLNYTLPRPSWTLHRKHLKLVFQSPIYEKRNT
ncbi:hypothetical protein IIV31_047L [Armadillidium vulgare iridescent virus]|uniref:Uncharacterized protein n=1 Tax=Armadillidium vulgare iridescent virus TaxID=72201 RepID=A0A068QLP1_9VIRU|nr:hypothetical protein IIV31_047L [Armadillidium vulgare iridescent virus]CCV02419.1 hypothetical protein IIV31_047L [Armadillidium vulgare iridescent virus]